MVTIRLEMNIFTQSGLTRSDLRKESLKFQTKSNTNAGSALQTTILAVKKKLLLHNNGCDCMAIRFISTCMYEIVDYQH